MLQPRSTALSRLPERELKLAIAAAERGHATAEQVLTAAARWIADPSRSLAERLEELGALAPPARAALEEELSAAPPAEQETIDSAWASDPPRPPGDPDAAPAVTPEAPDRYEVKGVHGQGGQAKVYLAVDRHLGREVAWKALSREQSEAARDSGSPLTSLERFLREARVTGQLEHPSIVPVHELGRRADGSFYYTMRLIRGRTLSEALQGQPLAGRLRLLGHFKDVCQALAFAHSRGVIHRDVKPSNVMVGEFGETVLLDWGLAKVRGTDDPRGRELEKRLKEFGQEGNSGQSLAGRALGTPAYMSPEQAEGRLQDVDERSDVWGLGALLYELLTGAPPFVGPTPMATLFQVTSKPVVPVRAACPEAPPELAAVAERALQKPREQRYQTAGELAAEVTAFMSGLRVSAYAYSPWELLGRFAVRHRAILTAAVAVFAAVVAALLVTGLALRSESAARAREQVARADETVARREARYRLAQAYVREADRLSDGQQALEARLYSAASLLQNPAHPASLDPDPGLAARTPEAGWLRIDALSLLFQTREHRIERLLRAFALDETVFRIAFSPDGRLLAAVDYRGTLKIWSAADFSERLSVKTGARLLTLAFTADSSLLLTGGEEKVVRLWDPATGKLVRALAPVADSIFALAVAPGGKLAASGDQGGHLTLWDLQTGAATPVGPPHAEQIREVAFSPDGRSLITGSWDKTARIWDVREKRVRATLTGHTDGVYGVAVSPDGGRVLTASYDGKLRLWALASGKPLATLDNGAEAYAAVFSPDARLLASVDAAGMLRLTDARSLQAEAAVRAHRNGGAVAVAFHPGGRLLATAGLDREVRVWALSAEGGAPRLAHDDWVYGVAFAAGGRIVATGCWDHAVRLWDAQTHALLRTLHGHTAGVLHLAASRDGTRLASAGYDATVRLWDVQTGAQLAVLKSERGVVRHVDFSPDGRLIAAGTAQGAALIWDTAAFARVATLDRHDGSIFGVKFSPDGKQLATAAGDYAVRLWETAGWTLLRKLDGHTDWASGLAWSPDGRTLASSGKDSAVILWDPASGQLLARLEGHRAWTSDVEFSPDGRLLVSAGEDERVILWDTATRSPLLRLRSARESTRAVFSPDGKELAVADHLSAVLYRLELPWTVADPQALLDGAQAASGLRLEGFSAVITPAPRP